MEIKSILIKDTTREERIHIVQEGLMSHISTAKRNCWKSMRNTGAIPVPLGRW